MREVHKPKLLQLAQKHGGVTKLSELLGISQSRVSQLIYSSSAISDTIAEKIFKLTKGKVNLFSKVSTKTPKKPKPTVKVKSNEETKKPVKAKAPGPKVQKPAKEESGTKEQSRSTTTLSEIFGLGECFRIARTKDTKDKPARPKVQKQTKQRSKLLARRLPRSRGAALFNET